MTDSFLHKIYTLDKINRDDALDLLFETVDDLCYEGQFEAIEPLLKEFDVDKCSTTLAVGVLSITFAAKDELPSRADFYNRVFLAVEKAEGSRKAEELLSRLK